MVTSCSVRRRLDSLVGLFAVGKGPSASADPFGLRRAAYALVQTLVENNVPLPLPAALRLTAEAQPVLVDNAVLAEVEQFVTRRLEQLLVSPTVDCIDRHENGDDMPPHRRALMTHMRRRWDSAIGVLTTSMAILIQPDFGVVVSMWRD